MKNRLRYAGTRGPLMLVTLAVALVLGAGLFLVVTAAPAQAQDETADGYYYTVQEGDSWGTVATQTGTSVADLKAANPDAVRDSDWLLSGEQLFVPYPQSTTEQVHVVDAGESWNSIASEYNVSVALLQAANPQAIRPGAILYRGEELVIPVPGAVTPTAVATEIEPAATETTEATSIATTEATATPTATPTITDTDTTATEDEEAAVEVEEAEVEETATETPEATVAPSATPSTSIVITITDVAAPADSSDEITATEEVTSSPALTATEITTDSVAGTGVATDTVSIDLPPCPETFTEYPDLMAEIVAQGPSGIHDLSIFLETCGALVEDAYISDDFTGDGEDDLVVVYQNPNQESAFIEADMIIFNSSADGLGLAYRARAAGEVRLLATSDINLDELPDVVWVDTTCGASTCFDTVNVRSWNGTEWTDWTDGTITMAYAEIELSDSLEDGAGEEITLSGGIYGSVGAGPQRSRVEVWASVDGSPYVLVEKVYNPSDCLYHTVLDANRAFLDAPTNDFADAEALYQQAATNASLIKCWVRNSELEELRSFSLFRLALIAGYQAEADEATARVATLVETYPSSVYAQVADLWLESYSESGSAAAACVDVTAYAEENPSTWEILADYGYTNPSFEAADVCPLLDL